MSRVFLLEDDVSLITGLTYSFKKQGYEIEIAKTMTEANSVWQKNRFDLLILDVSLPDGSGFDFCRKVRKESDVPIIFLTASDEEMNVIMGLDMGGDDYIAKPFKLGVLLSRINALLRRSKGQVNDAPKTVWESNGIYVSLLEGAAYKDGINLELSAGEYKLLCYFMQNPGHILTKKQILDKLWDSQENYIDSSALTVYIRRLRLKIEDNPGEPQRLVTVRGMGYKWNLLGE